MTYISVFYDTIAKRKVEAFFFTFFKRNVAEMLKHRPIMATQCARLTTMMAKRCATRRQNPVNGCQSMALRKRLFHPPKVPISRHKMAHIARQNRPNWKSDCRRCQNTQNGARHISLVFILRYAIFAVLLQNKFCEVRLRLGRKSKRICFVLLSVCANFAINFYNISR